MKNKITLILLLILAGVSCKREEFNTKLDISLVSGIPILKGEPVPLYITKSFVDKNQVYTHDVMTLYTDSFGKFSGFVKLKKPKAKEFYKIELKETFWRLPIEREHTIEAGIPQILSFRIKPKWLKYIYFQDSSNKFKPTNVFFTINTSLPNYNHVIYNFDQNSPNNYHVFKIGVPSDACLYVNLFLKDKTTNKNVDRIDYKIISNNQSIWLNY